MTRKQAIKNRAKTPSSTKKSASQINIFEHSLPQNHDRLSLDQKIDHLRQKLNTLQKDIRKKIRSSKAQEKKLLQSQLLNVPKKKSQKLLKILFLNKENNDPCLPSLKSSKKTLNIQKDENILWDSNNVTKQLSSEIKPKKVYLQVNSNIQEKCVQNRKSEQKYIKDDKARKEALLFWEKFSLHQKMSHEEIDLMLRPKKITIFQPVSKKPGFEGNKVQESDLSPQLLSYNKLNQKEARLLRVHSLTKTKNTSHNLNKSPCSNIKIYESSFIHKKQRSQLKIHKRSHDKASLAITRIIQMVHGIVLSTKLNEGAQKKVTYKFMLKKGNNEGLIRRMMQKRGWKQTNCICEANFVWSQRKQSSFTQKLGPLQMTSESPKTKKTQSFDPASTAFQLILQHEKQHFLQKNSITSFKQILIPRIHNHLSYNYVITHKKYLFRNLQTFYRSKNVDPFLKIPMTFHVGDLHSKEWIEFVNKCKQSVNELWIVKPGENSNRGCGIKVFASAGDISSYISEKKMENSQMTFIIQKYLKPYLYNGRKFDLRCYLLVTVIDDQLRAYWYSQGYVRTSSKPYSETNLKDKFIHLTNDAIQMKCEDYGKYQPCNKLSFLQLTQYMLKKSELNFKEEIIPQLIMITREIVQASYLKIHEQDRNVCFEVYGLDFMIDESGKPWLIQVNRNPSLQAHCSLLQSLIANMIDNALCISLDPFYPTTLQKHHTDFTNRNKFKCIFQATDIWNSKNSTTAQSNLYPNEYQ